MKKTLCRAAAIAMSAVFTISSMTEPFAGIYFAYAQDAPEDEPEGIDSEPVLTTAADWEYTFDEEEKTVTLEKYIGDETNIVIPGTLQVGLESCGVIFRSMGAGSEGSTASHVVSVSFDEGVAAYPQSILSDDGPEPFFGSCSGLESIDLSGLFTGEMTNMDYMFHDCSSLKSVDLRRRCLTTTWASYLQLN